MATASMAGRYHSPGILFARRSSAEWGHPAQSGARVFPTGNTLSTPGEWRRKRIMDNDTTRRTSHQESDASRTNLKDRGRADNTRGKLNQAGGKVQEELGKVTGKKKLEHKGQARQAR